MAVETQATRIVVYPEPCLRERCQRVEDFDGSLELLARRMFELMREGNGVGLAGPQVGLPLRVFACNPTGDPKDGRFYVNPELVDLTGAVEAEEGCLSLPEIRVNVRRARKCRIKACDLTGRPIEQEAEDLLARIWQHETDHLDGHLIIDRMGPTDKIANKKLITQLEDDFRKKRKT